MLNLSGLPGNLVAALGSVDVLFLGGALLGHFDDARGWRTPTRNYDAIAERTWSTSPANEVPALRPLVEGMT